MTSSGSARQPQRAAEARGFARERAAAQGLPIKVFRAEVQAGGKATFYFASDAAHRLPRSGAGSGRALHMRIEMRQVGVRDEAKMVGGIGSCGRELCCSTFLPASRPVSIKMAKNQNLALTPSKVSGQCGRLKCCLVYEEATYIEAAKALPKHGQARRDPRRRRPGRRSGRAARARPRLFDGPPPKVFTADRACARLPRRPPRRAATAPSTGDDRRREPDDR